MQFSLSEIKDAGAQLVAISPQLPDQSLTLVEKQKLEFCVLSDIGNQVARKFGLVFTLPEALRPVYSSFGIDLPASNGDSTFVLPVPANYVVGQNGTIIFDFVEVDHTKRVEPSKIVEVLSQ